VKEFLHVPRGHLTARVRRAAAAVYAQITQIVGRVLTSFAATGHLPCGRGRRSRGDHCPRRRFRRRTAGYQPRGWWATSTNTFNQMNDSEIDLPSAAW